MDLNPVSTQYTEGATCLRSRIGVQYGTVNIDSDDVSADGDGKKILARNTILYKQTNGFFKKITSGALAENYEFAILDEKADVTNGNGSFRAIKAAADVYEDRLTPTISTADKAILRHQFGTIN